MKNADKNSKLKSILFEHGSISRQSLIHLSGMNPRTVSRCMDALAAKKLLTITQQRSGQGRPAQYYTLQKGTVRIVHFMVTKDEIYTVVSDFRRFPLYLSRAEFEWQKLRPEMLTAKLKQLAVEVLELPEVKNGLVVAAGVGHWLPEIPSGNVCQRWTDTLETVFLCKCPVLNADELFLSQYQVNNQLSGKVLGLSYRDDIRCAAVNDSVIDHVLQLKAEKIIADCGAKNMGFGSYVKQYHPEELAGLKDFSPDKYYSAQCMLAMNGNEKARRLLRGYGNFLGRVFISLAECKIFDHLVLMHPRQVVSDGVMDIFSAEYSGVKMRTANFSSNEFILAPAGYLGRRLMEFEHGRIMPGN